MARVVFNGYTEKFPYENTPDRFFDVNITIKSEVSGEVSAPVRVFKNGKTFHWSWSVPSVEQLDEKWNYSMGEYVLKWCELNIR
jgi:hypothetical protein